MAELVLTHLVKRYGTVQAVQDVSFSAADGEFLCILGPSGCGKSTTLRMIGGFERLDGGDIAIDGRSVGTLPPNRRPTAMVFQKYTLWPHMRVHDNVAFGLTLRRLPSAQIARMVREALDLVGLPDAGRRYPSQLSGGEQQRIALARALVLEPHVLLLDEPLSNLDARLRLRLREEIKRIQRRTGITTIFVTHDQEEALAIADRIVVMSNGRVEQVDTPSRLYAQPRTRFVADFVGTMNHLQGHYQRAAAAITIDDPTLPTSIASGQTTLPASGADWADGQPLHLAIRPEDLRLVPAAQPCTFTGRLELIMDLGHFRQLDVHTPTERLTVFVPKDHRLLPGATLHLQPTRYLAFAGDHDPLEFTLPAPATPSPLPPNRADLARPALFTNS